MELGLVALERAEIYGSNLPMEEEELRARIEKREKESKKATGSG
jgi:hypothetical protein